MEGLGEDLELLGEDLLHLVVHDFEAHVDDGFFMAFVDTVADTACV